MSWTQDLKSMSRLVTGSEDRHMALSVVDQRILFSIAEGGKSFYDFTRKEKIGSNVMVLTSLKRLQNVGSQGLIYQGAIEARGKKPYLLTEDGFDFVLRDISRILDFNQFVRAYEQHFPFVFNYWDELEKYELQEWVRYILENVMEYIDFRVRNELFTGIISRYSHEEFVTDLLTQIYGPFLIIRNIEEMKEKIPEDKIRRFIREKEVLRQTIEKQTQSYKERFERNLEYIINYEENFL